MNARDVRRLLDRHRPPRPSDRLRRRVLAAAAGDAARPTASPSLSDRLWFSRPLRVGWAAALFLLVVVQVMVADSAERQLRRIVDPPAVAVESPAAAAARELGIEPGGSMRHVPARRPVGPSELPAGLD